MLPTNPSAAVLSCGNPEVLCNLCIQIWYGPHFVVCLFVASTLRSSPVWCLQCPQNRSQWADGYAAFSCHEISQLPQRTSNRRSTPLQLCQNSPFVLQSDVYIVTSVQAATDSEHECPLDGWTTMRLCCFSNNILSVELSGSEKLESTKARPLLLGQRHCLQLTSREVCLPSLWPGTFLATLHQLHSLQRAPQPIASNIPFGLLFVSGSEDLDGSN